MKMKNVHTGKSVIVPYHSKDLKKGLEQAILKQAGIRQFCCVNGGLRMNKRLFYPAVFHRAEEGGFWVTFPDIRMYDTGRRYAGSI